MSVWLVFNSVLEQSVYQSAFKVAWNPPNFEVIFFLFVFLQTSCHSGPIIYLPLLLQKNLPSFQSWNYFIFLRKISERWKQNSVCNRKIQQAEMIAQKRGSSWCFRHVSQHQAHGQSIDQEQKHQKIFPLSCGDRWRSKSNSIVLFLPYDSVEWSKHWWSSPWVQSYPGKCPYRNKTTADSTTFINRSIVNLFILFTCQLSYVSLSACLVVMQNAVRLSA